MKNELENELKIIEIEAKANRLKEIDYLISQSKTSIKESRRERYYICVGIEALDFQFKDLWLNKSVLNSQEELDLNNDICDYREDLSMSLKFHFEHMKHEGLKIDALRLLKNKIVNEK